MTDYSKSHLVGPSHMTDSSRARPAIAIARSSPPESNRHEEGDLRETADTTPPAVGPAGRGRIRQLQDLLSNAKGWRTRQSGVTTCSVVRCTTTAQVRTAKHSSSPPPGGRGDISSLLAEFTARWGRSAGRQTRSPTVPNAAALTNQHRPRTPRYPRFLGCSARAMLRFLFEIAGRSAMSSIPTKTVVRRAPHANRRRHCMGHSASGMFRQRSTSARPDGWVLARVLHRTRQLHPHRNHAAKPHLSRGNLALPG